MNYFLRKAIRVLGWLIIFISIFILATNIWVVSSTQDRIISDFNNLPDSSVALVLGTSNKRSNGSPNVYFLERIKTAAKLYKEGKAIHFLLSGDNRTKYYNEPAEMKKALMKASVPESVITLDFAGLRTLDSIVRSKEIFGQNKIIIVTQSFHCYRALFISKFYGIDAVTFLDEPPNVSIKVKFREWFARTKAVLDLYVFETMPRHLGNKEPLEL